LVTQVGRVDDQAANQAAWDAIQQAKAEGLAEKTDVIETIDYRDYEANVRAFVEAGYDVVVTVGNDAGAATYTIAALYPKVYFIGADQRSSVDQENLPNLVWLVFPEDHLGFLAGALAAAMTQTGKVGAVCGSDAWPPMKSYGDGFMAGVLYINPDVKATVTYHNEVSLNASLYDTGWGEAAANSLLDEGADIVFGVGGTTGSSALESAASRGAYVIGADIDQYFALPAAAPRMLTSVHKLVKPGVFNLLKAARDSLDNKSAFREGIYYGQIDFSPYHELDKLIPATMKQQMAALLKDLLSGDIRPNELIPTP
jgi:basic membrane protein A